MVNQAFRIKIAYRSKEKEEKEERKEKEENTRDRSLSDGPNNRGVYSSVYSYIHIYKKLPFLADFITNWAHFIKKNSDVISLVIYQSQPKMH